MPHPESGAQAGDRRNVVERGGDVRPHSSDRVDRHTLFTVRAGHAHGDPALDRGLPGVICPAPAWIT